MKKIITFSVLMLSIIFSSCTPNKLVKQYGGKLTIDVESGYKVTNATFKDDEIWYFVEKVDSTYVPTTKKLIEKSSFGVLEGEVIFIEHK